MTAATERKKPPVDFQRLFESLPGLYLILMPDLSIVAASNAYLNATMTQRENITGRNIFDVFPDNPDDPVSRMKSVKASLLKALETRMPDTMPIQKYDIRKPESEGGGFEERYWSPINSPYFDEKGNVAYIIHRVEDVTEFVKLDEQMTRDKSVPSPAGHMQTDVYLRAKEVGEINQKLREMSDETRRLLSAIVEGSQDAIISKTLDGVITSWNAGAERLLGHSAEEAIGKHINIIIPQESREEERLFIEQLRMGKRIENLETVRIRKDGTKVPIAVSISPIFNENGKVVGASKVARDISERLEYEKTRDQLRQAQKMEALGQLTGGIAHDFNNLLAVILGNLDFLSERIEKTSPLREFIDPGIEAAEHGAELTGQLLAFGRKQSLQPKIISVNDMLTGFLPLVSHTLGERLKIATSLTEDAWNANVDPAQKLKNALLNLSVNARDAMPDGGKLIYETQNVVFDEDYVESNAEVITAGEYVMIAVSDTGSGMTLDVMEKAFEPFFTTKEIGRGTGLGLSMVYGFVKQSRGYVKLYSEVGHGTSVKIFLPRSESVPTETSEQSSDAEAPVIRKAKKILVVEDNRSVLKLTSAMVESLGYDVIQAGSGDAAMVILEKRSDIVLLLTDVMLPGVLNGPALAKRAQQIHPDLKVLFNSGYAKHAIVQSGMLEEGMHLISKPFRKLQLGEKIAELIK